MDNACIAPQEMEEGDLVAFIEGEASLRVQAHLARCRVCRAEAEGLRLLLQQVRPGYNRAACPDAETLLLYATDSLLALQGAEVDQHLRSCLPCKLEVDELAASLVEPHEAPVSQPALHSGRGWLEQLVERVTEGWRVLAATALTPISPALATRGSGTPTAVYQAGEYQILVRVTPDETVPARLAVEGWLAQDAATEPLHPAVVQLIEGERVVSSSEIDEMGHFALENLQPGTYTLQLELRTTLVVIDALEANLGER